MKPDKEAARRVRERTGGIPWLHPDNRRCSARHRDWDDPIRQPEVEAELTRPSIQYTMRGQDDAPSNIEMYEYTHAARLDAHEAAKIEEAAQQFLSQFDLFLGALQSG